MSPWLAFMLGAIVGGVGGILVAALCNAASDDDELL